jgi:hypothetical protein
MRELSLAVLMLIGSYAGAVALENCDAIHEPSRRMACLYKNNLELQKEVSDLKAALATIPKNVLTLPVDVVISSGPRRPIP